MKGKPEGDWKSLHEKQKNDMGRERERINEFVPLLAQEPPYTITHNVGFSENICCQQPVSPH